MEFNAGNIKSEPPKIIIGQVVTKPAGSLAKINAKEANKDVVLNFEIPKGDRGDKGDTGTSISQIIQTFAVSSDGFNHPTSGWNSSIPARMYGDHLWSKLSIRMSDNTINDFYIVLPETPAAVTPQPTVPIIQTQSGTFKLGFNTFNEPDKELITAADLSSFESEMLSDIKSSLEETENNIQEELSTTADEIKANIVSLAESKAASIIEEYTQSIDPIINSLSEEISQLKEDNLEEKYENSGSTTIIQSAQSLFNFSKKIPAIPKGSPDGEYALIGIVKDGEASYEWRS